MQRQLSSTVRPFTCKAYNSHHVYRCIADNETECPSCAAAHGAIRETRLNNEKLAHQHDLFVSDVQDNGFEAVAIAFSRGLLSSKLEEAI